MDAPTKATDENRSPDCHFVEFMWEMVRDGVSTTRCAAPWSRGAFDSRVQHAWEQAIVSHPNADLSLQKFCRDLEIWKYFGFGTFPDWHPFVANFVNPEKAGFPAMDRPAPSPLTAPQKLFMSAHAAQALPPREKNPRCVSPVTYERLGCSEVKNHERHFELTKNFKAEEGDKNIPSMYTVNPTLALPKKIPSKDDVDARADKPASTYEVKPAVFQQDEVPIGMGEPTTVPESINFPEMEYADEKDFPPLTPPTKVNTDSSSPTQNGKSNKPSDGKHANEGVMKISQGKSGATKDGTQL